MSLRGLLDRFGSGARSGAAVETAASTEEPQTAGGADLAANLPALLGTALFAATLVLMLLRFTSVATPPVVVFDIIKYANAQRAVASRFLASKNSEEVAPILMDVSKKTRDTIREVAGSNTVVLIRQSVVQGETRDITDEVLKRLGLPTDVPTADPTRHTLDVAPTLLGHGPLLPSGEESNPRTVDDGKARQSAGLP